MNQILKNSFFVFALSLVVFSACKKEDEVNNATCNIDDPLETIDWLKQIKETFELSMQPTASKIIQYEYNGECVFWIEDCVNCPDALAVVYNEAQEIVCQFGSIAGLNTCPDFADEATGEVVLWDGM